MLKKTSGQCLKTLKKFVKFVSSLGVKDLENHISSPSIRKYLSSSTVTQMVTCISDLLERQALADLQDKEFALLADENTDVSSRSQMSVMARFSRSNQTVGTYFLDFIPLKWERLK